MRNISVMGRKIVTSWGFGFCVVMTTLLFIFADAYTDEITKEHFSVIRALTDMKYEERIQHSELCNLVLMYNSRGHWFTLFVPIIAAFCYVPMFTAEREGRAVRYEISRTSRVGFFTAEFFTGIILGGIAVTIGYLFFGLFAMNAFPSVSEMTADIGMLQNLEQEQFILKMAFQVFLYGVYWSIPAMFCTSFLRNKYLIMCIPFFVKYVWTQIYKKIADNAMNPNEFDIEKIRLAERINPEGILWIYDGTKLDVILLFGISAASLFAAYLIIVLKRDDCGA